MYGIDFGEHGWKHPETEGITYGSRESAVAYAKNNDLDPEKVFEIDTRPTVSEVAKQIRDDGCAAAWDECGPDPLSLADRTVGSLKWPEGRIKVFVVTGGSEGLYLHVEVDDKFLIIAKTLNSSIDKWYECWMSCARIARMLGA